MSEKNILAAWDGPYITYSGDALFSCGCGWLRKMQPHQVATIARRLGLRDLANAFLIKPELCYASKWTAADAKFVPAEQSDCDAFRLATWEGNELFTVNAHLDTLNCSQIRDILMQDPKLEPVATILYDKAVDGTRLKNWKWGEQNHLFAALSPDVVAAARKRLDEYNVAAADNAPETLHAFCTRIGLPDLAFKCAENDVTTVQTLYELNEDDWKRYLGVTLEQILVLRKNKQ